MSDSNAHRNYLTSCKSQVLIQQVEGGVAGGVLHGLDASWGGAEAADPGTTLVVMLSVPATGQKKDLDQGSVKVCSSRQLVMKIGPVTFVFQLS